MVSGREEFASSLIYLHMHDIMREYISTEDGFTGILYKKLLKRNHY